jgi:drug/metabolite transporter (DMT)-like permease
MAADVADLLGDSGVGFALVSFAFAGLNDLVFKRYSLGDRSRGMLVLGIGVTWTALQLAVFGAQAEAQPLRFDAATVRFGLASGALLVVSNLLLLESFTHVDLGLGSTVYRLNTLAVVVLSYLLLGEPVGPTKAAGIALGLLAVFLLSSPPSLAPHRARHGLFVAAVAAASLLRAGYGVVTKQAMLAGVEPRPLLLVISSCWIVGGALYALARERRLRLTREKARYAAVSGTLVFLIVYSLMRAVEQGEASVVIPIANMSFVVALAISLATGMERLTPRKAVAVAAAVGAIVLLSRA